MYPAASLPGYTAFDDLWEYSPANGQWTWAGGTQSTADSAPGQYGTLGMPAPTNLPGARSSSTSWLDGSGKLWLFGGSGADSAGSIGMLNDLWTYGP